jgi:hypothetical protein
MTQPKYAPIAISDEVRPASKLEPPKPWFPHRPAEYRHGARVPSGGLGAPGTDQGYALGLAERFEDRVVLGHGEHLDDAIAAAVVVALRRASGFGRAPVSLDLEFAFGLLGYLGEVSAETAAVRRAVVSGAAHDYWISRRVADLIPAATVRSLAKPLVPFDWVLAATP